MTLHTVQGLESGRTIFLSSNLAAESYWIDPGQVTSFQWLQFPPLSNKLLNELTIPSSITTMESPEMVRELEMTEKT